MAWKQLIAPVVEISEVAGMCLSYARRVFGRPVVEPTAWSGWTNAKYKHEDRNFPSGVAVPVWFDWTGDVGAGRQRYGHVAVRMPDGKVWSSPLSGTGRNWFASVDDLTRAFGNGMRYVGWSEDISNGRVVIEEEDVYKPTAAEVAGSVLRLTGTAATQQQINYYSGRGVDVMLNDLMERNYQDKLSYSNQLVKVQEALKQSNAALEAAKASGSGSEELKKQLADQIKQNEKLSKQVTKLDLERQADTDTGNAFLRFIGSFFNNSKGEK